MGEYPDINSLIRGLISHHPKVKEEAWSYFIKKYGKLINHCLKNSLSFHATKEDRDDCFMLIISKLLGDDCRRLKQFRSNNEKAFHSYLCIIAKRFAWNFSRNGIGEFVPKSEESLAFLPDESIDIDQETLWAEIIAIINNCLPEQERLVALFLLEGLTLEEIADIMDLKLGKVFEIKKRAISIIKNILKERLNNK